MRAIATETKQNRRNSITKKAKVVAPCILLIFLLAAFLAQNQGNHYGWNTPLRLKMWGSVVLGPFACWIEFSGELSTQQKLLESFLGVVLAVGISSHALSPKIVTAAATITTSVLWLFFGISITFIGL